MILREKIECYLPVCLSGYNMSVDSVVSPKKKWFEESCCVDRLYVVYVSLSEHTTIIHCVPNPDCYTGQGKKSRSSLLSNATNQK